MGVSFLAVPAQFAPEAEPAGRDRRDRHVFARFGLVEIGLGVTLLLARCAPGACSGGLLALLWPIVRRRASGCCRCWTRAPICSCGARNRARAWHGLYVGAEVIKLSLLLVGSPLAGSAAARVDVSPWRTRITRVVRLTSVVFRCCRRLRRVARLARASPEPKEVERSHATTTSATPPRRTVPVPVALHRWVHPGRRGRAQPAAPGGRRPLLLPRPAQAVRRRSSRLGARRVHRLRRPQLRADPHATNAGEVVEMTGQPATRVPACPEPPVSPPGRPGARGDCQAAPGRASCARHRRFPAPPRHRQQEVSHDQAFQSPHRRPDPGRPARDPRRRHGLRRARRELSRACSTRSTTAQIRYVVCRQEGGAAMMAEAYGKLTGRPGIAMVTRGPGATNGCHGVHIARQDSTPMILLIGQVGARDARARGVPGDRLPADVRRHRQVGRRDRRSGADPGAGRRARSTPRPRAGRGRS